jgi:polyribonucleotide 5'-hydroxyl-kinase
VAEDTPNVSYINCHQVIHNLREEAKSSGGQGPRVVVAGPTDSGKSSMCRMLLNWAVRAQHQPTYVDLDIGEALSFVCFRLCLFLHDYFTCS